MTTSSTPERPSVVRRSVAAGRPETKYAEAYDGPRMQLRIEQRRDEPGQVRTAVMRHSRREASVIRPAFVVAIAHSSSGVRGPRSPSTRRCRFGERAMIRVTFSSLPRAESPRKQADIAQLVERNLAKVEVAGSSPVVRSIPISGAIGAAVARFLDTEEVTGSNPVSPTITSRPSACRRRP